MHVTMPQDVGGWLLFQIQGLHQKRTLTLINFKESFVF